MLLSRPPQTALLSLKERRLPNKLYGILGALPG